MGTLRLPRFAAVGVLNTALDLGLFLLLHGALGIVAANLVSTSAGMLCSFVLNGRWTFGAAHLTWGQAGRFLATTGVTMWLLSPAVIEVLAGPAGLPLTVAKLGAIAACLGANLAAYRFLVWPEPVAA